MSEQRRLKAWQLKEVLDQLPDEADVNVRFEGTPNMVIEKVSLEQTENGGHDLVLVLPAQPLDTAVDSDLTRLCENMVTGKSTIFQVRFGMDVMKQCNATTPATRLEALSMYFRDAKAKVDEVIEFGEEAGRMAAEESDDE